jgi:hypothetical protein
MAMFEHEGFCPNNSFHDQPAVNPYWEKTQQLLGDRLGFMVYTKGGCNYNGCYVTGAIKGCRGFLGLDIAYTLKFLNPHCKYAEYGARIKITDLINPYACPIPIGTNGKGEWGLVTNNGKDPEDTYLFEDEDYVVVIKKEGEGEINMYIFKK